MSVQYQAHHNSFAETLVRIIMNYKRYFLFAALIPQMAFGQTNDRIKAAAGEESTTREEYIFPDHYRFYKKELNERIQKKTAALTQCLQNLAGKQGVDRKAEIDKAMKLFNNDESKLVTVTSKKHPEPVIMPVRKYLEHFAGLPYTKISVVWRNATYMSNFVKQPDDTYAAIVAVEQKFVGINKGEAKYTYRDLTEKRIEVTVKAWDVKEGGKITKAYMDVFLGNIGVKEQEVKK